MSNVSVIAKKTLNTVLTTQKDLILEEKFEQKSHLIKSNLLRKKIARNEWSRTFSKSETEKASFRKKNRILGEKKLYIKKS